MPIFERIPPSRKRLYSIEDIVQLLLHPPLRVSRFISTCVPTSVCESVTFVVDVDHLENQDDVLANDMGVWKNNGVDMNYVHATLSERKVTSVWTAFSLISIPNTCHRWDSEKADSLHLW